MASIAELEQKIAQKEKKVKQYRKRQTAVKEAGNLLSSKLPGRIKDANAKIKSSADHLEDGLKLAGRSPQAVVQIRGLTEDSIGSDRDISEMANEIEEERCRCGKKIETLNAEIASLKKQLASLKEAEGK